MPTALDIRDQPAPTENPTAPPQYASKPSQRAFRIQPTRDVARELGRYVSAIVAKVRATLDTHRGTGDAEEPSELIIELSHATQLPTGATDPSPHPVATRRRQRHDHHTVGRAPMVLGSLVAFDLPDDVVVVDTRGRRWTNARRTATS